LSQATGAGDVPLVSVDFVLHDVYPAGLASCGGRHGAGGTIQALLVTDAVVTSLLL
jgi:hypothetical protein